MNLTDRILLILDLDETLVHVSEEPLGRKADFRFQGFFGHVRPHLEPFLTECASRFQLAIWSSGTDDYVTEIVKRILPPAIPLAFVWGRSRCTFAVDKTRVMNDGHLDPDSHYGYVKKLHKLKRRGYRLERVLIVDDTPAKCVHNHGNAIYVREYDGQKHDTELLDLSRYLATLAEADNVRRIEKRDWRSQLLPPGAPPAP
ncbi:HAD family hydrolase [Corallococcus sp. bb12-1]|uniref:NIF family HAD-type phosphatase n=1 Tax=Corallococcus sp. bb12-1 TaxID=2996784 RepID=UPI00226FC4BD|nr:HAD family hydrolase [Corallococcus sp. bb12-1]MCY1043854.1 HAD family hydrolase [Corallococcus sp. bb12-1]